MKTVRAATEDEMLLIFLKGEYVSVRFSKELKAALEKAAASERIITEGDYTNPKENEARKLVMKYFRGYPDREIFSEYPVNARWEYVQFDEQDLDNIYYVDYCYWNELSDKTSSPGVGAKNVLAGKTVYDVPNTNFYAAADYLKEKAFMPIILIEKGRNRFELLEGHVRATAYGMCPGKFAGTCGYVGHRE